MFKVFLSVMLFAFVLSCKNPEGRFAFKFPQDDAYRMSAIPPEISTGGKLHWVCSFGGSVSREDVSVIVEKKEMMWIEVAGRKDYIASDKPSVFGIISGYDAGVYRIVITENSTGKQLAAGEFFVYDEGE